MPNIYTKRSSEQAVAEKLARMEAAGIPDSRPPIAEEGTFESNRIDGCHVNGVSVKDLPAQARAALTYWHTDEGIAEKDAEYQRKLEAGRIASGIEFPSAEEVEKRRFDQMRDRLKDGADVADNADPLRETAEKHCPPGYRWRWLDNDCCDQLGMRGWEPLKKNGELVKCGQSFLGIMPEAEGREADRRREARRTRRMQAFQQSVQEQVSQLDHAARSAGLTHGAKLDQSPIPAGLQISTDLGEIQARERR